MGLVASRVQSEINQGNSSNIQTAVYWLHAATLRVDKFLAELGRNSDAEAVKLASQLMNEAADLPPVETKDLEPHTQREFGSELANGKQTARLFSDQTISIKKKSTKTAAK